MKRILAVLIAAVMLLSAASALAEPFRVGMECAYAPFNWQQTEADENSVPIDGGVGYAGGYDVEIARRIADGLGRELVIVKLEWDGLIPALQSNMIDAVIAGMSPTAERKMTVSFSDSYYTSNLVVVVRKDGAYADATQAQRLRRREDHRPAEHLPLHRHRPDRGRAEGRGHGHLRGHDRGAERGRDRRLHF